MKIAETRAKNNYQMANFEELFDIAGQKISKK